MMRCGRDWDDDPSRIHLRLARHSGRPMSGYHVIVPLDPCQDAYVVQCHRTIPGSCDECCETELIKHRAVAHIEAERINDRNRNWSH